MDLSSTEVLPNFSLLAATQFPQILLRMRYLNVSRNPITKLPEAITDLQLAA
ncbi:hypothetical protein ACS0TY_027073 [Phlomoides rotata]